MFTRVLVANRGEIAVRVIRALHELDVEAVAIYSTADRDSLHVRLADQAVCVGPPSATESYLRIPNVIAAAETTGCEAVHPGLRVPRREPRVRRGVRRQRPRLRRAARGRDGDDGRQDLREAGDARRRRADGSRHRGRDDRRRGARRRRTRSAIPILLKASAGGGGKGMRLVQSADELEDAFGDGRGRGRGGVRRPDACTSRRRSSPARHVEIQVLCDQHGNVLTLGERECSIQRRHQKLIEESPSAALTPEAREAMEAAAERACRAVGYRNAGTFEFLLGPDGSFYFIELNARLQVEHPVTELCTGIDLVREQLRVAAGEQLVVTGRAPRRGHAIEIRLNAEDPEHDFRPSPGRIDALPARARARACASTRSSSPAR